MSTLSSVSDGDFDSEVLQSDIPVLVDYWATWCRPCQMITPILEEIAKDYDGKIKVLKLNVEENQAIPSKYAIQGIPTLMIYKNGKLVGTKAGYMTKTQIASFIDSSI